jgi:hypothetical protein
LKKEICSLDQSKTELDTKHRRKFGNLQVHGITQPTDKQSFIEEIDVNKQLL